MTCTPLTLRYVALSAFFAMTSCSDISSTTSSLRDVQAVSLSDCLGGSDSTIVSPLGDPHGQGSDLLGLGFTFATSFVHVDRFDGRRITTSAGAPVGNVSARSLALVGSVARYGRVVPLEGEQWTGAELIGQLHCPAPSFAGRSIDVVARIAQVTRQLATETNAGPDSPAEQLAWVYRLELELESGTTVLNACRDPDDVAFPIPGYWDAAASYIRDDTQFSFVCLQRDVAKCLRQGYLHDSPKRDDRVPLFEACTRMMRADYCGDGNSYTIDGTQIDMWDNRGIAVQEHREPFAFESAWTPRGMACYQRPRWPAEDLPGRKLPDCLQRTASNMCDSPETAEALRPGQPLLFTESCPQQPCPRVSVTRP